MATLSPMGSPATVLAASIVSSNRLSQRRMKVNYVSGQNSFGALKTHNNVATLGLSICTEHSFAKIISSLKQPSRGRGRGGGALSSTCNAIAEIFRIASIMPGLVLVGVAVGFVFLPVKAMLEEE